MCVDVVFSGEMCAPKRNASPSRTYTYASVSCARPARIDFDFPALQHHARLEAVLDEIVEARLAVLGDQAFGLCGFGHEERGWGSWSIVRRLYLCDNPRMRQVTRSALVAQPPSRMFALINDIERYPDFVPGCTHARVETRTPTEIIATLGVRRGPHAGRDHHAQHPRARPPGHDDAGARAVQRARRGVEAHAGGTEGCRVELFMRFAFANRDVGDRVRAAVRADGQRRSSMRSSRVRVRSN